MPTSKYPVDLPIKEDPQLCLKVNSELSNYGLTEEYKVGRFTAADIIRRKLELSSYADRQKEVVFLDEALSVLKEGLSDNIRKKLIKLVKIGRLIPEYTIEEVLERNKAEALVAQDILTMFSLSPNSHIGTYTALEVAEALADHLKQENLYSNAIRNRITTLIDSLSRLRPIVGIDYILNPDLSLADEHEIGFEQGFFRSQVSIYSPNDSSKLKTYFGYNAFELKQIGELLSSGDQLALNRYVGSGSSDAIMEILVREGYIDENKNRLVDAQTTDERLKNHYIKEVFTEEEISRAYAVGYVARFRNWLDSFIKKA